MAVEPAVVARAAGEDQHRVDVLEDAVGAVAEELRRDAGDRVERVGDRLRLLEDLLLHVVPIRAELGGAGVRDHGAHRALDATVVAVRVGAADPVLAELQVDDVALLEVDDAVGDAGERHRVGGEEVLARSLPTPSTSGEPWRAPTTRCGSSRQNTAIA